MIDGRTVRFPTDEVFVVRKVRCFGCPADPFPLLQSCWREGVVDRSCLGPIDYDVSRDFDPAIVERSHPGEKIEARRNEGWGWDELEQIDPKAGGASRAEVDALRLMAVFLAHWDNKPRNQRLLCLDARRTAPGNPTGVPDTGGPRGASRNAAGASATSGVSSTACSHPLAMIADAGGTFGPDKVDLKGWSSTPIWLDRAACVATMKSLPYGGSTFHDVRISEAGRRLAADLFGALSEAQIRQLFSGARFPNVDGWVKAFVERRRLITDGPSC